MKQNSVQGPAAACAFQAILIRQSTWSLRGLEPFFVGGCLQNCRPSSYCDTQTANFPNSPLGGDVVLWRTMEETGQQAPESGLWAQIPVPSSPSSCVALLKSLNRLQLVFKMEKKKNLLPEIAEKLSGMFVGCLAHSVCPLLLGPAHAALHVLGRFFYHLPPKRQGCVLHSAVGTGFLWPLCCFQRATSAVFFLQKEAASTKTWRCWQLPGAPKKLFSDLQETDQFTGNRKKNQNIE